MKFLIITHVLHKSHNGQIWGYGPYIREMNLWEKHIDSLFVVAPKLVALPSAIDLPYQSRQVQFIEVPQFNIAGAKNLFKSLFIIPTILFRIFITMSKADHIHLRCPGNMGLLGAIVQICFPHKKKTAKYAGNWDWNSKQPWSYRLQQRILRNTFLTRNIQFLVYGDWPDRNRNIKPFFTASYSEKDKIPVEKPSMDEGINLIFVGTLGKNKRPILAIEVLHKLLKEGFKVNLEYCGEGPEKSRIQDFISANSLETFTHMFGNISAARVNEAYRKAHFLIFPSESEGWPKVVAEAMWWGCIPITTAVSYVPQMLGNGQRGVICEPDADVIVTNILNLINHQKKLVNMRHQAMEWSSQYTLEKFEEEVKMLLKF